MTMLGILPEKIVRRHYTLDDVAKAQYLQNKFENVDTIAKDSCFHFHYMGTKLKIEIMTIILLLKRQPLKNILTLD